MLQFEGWLETNTDEFPAMVVSEFNCYRNTKSDFSIKVPILQCIWMDSDFIHTRNRLFSLGDHT